MHEQPDANQDVQSTQHKCTHPVTLNASCEINNAYDKTLDRQDDHEGRGYDYERSDVRRVLLSDPDAFIEDRR